MSLFLQETCKTCKNCAFKFLAQFLVSSKNLVRNLQGARILHVKCPFSCSVSRILQDIFPWDPNTHMHSTACTQTYAQMDRHTDNAVAM